MAAEQAAEDNIDDIIGTSMVGTDASDKSNQDSWGKGDGPSSGVNAPSVGPEPKPIASSAKGDMAPDIEQL